MEREMNFPEVVKVIDGLKVVLPIKNEGMKG